MKQRLKRMKADSYRGFPISEEEAKDIEDWKRRHDEEDHGYTLKMQAKVESYSGGRYKYIFQ